MQELSVPDSELPQRCATLSVRCFITWWQFCGTLPSHSTRQFPMSLATDASHGGGRTPATMHWLLATQRGETFEGLTFRKTTLSSPPVGFTSTVWFAQPAADSGDLGKTASPACACRTPGLARVVSADASDCQTVAAHPMPQWRSSSVGSTRACDHWRMHFSSVTASGAYDDFSPDFSRSITRRFFDLTADVSPGPFDAPFSASELSNALSLCHDSAPGPSVHQPRLPWWHHMLLNFFNLVLRWNVVPSSWKLSHVVPFFKHGDPAEPDHYRPISLASCAFKIFERLVHGRIAPHISDRLDECQGGFRWGADACVYGPLGLRGRLSGCTRLGSLEACGAQWPISFVAHSHRSEFAGTYLRCGSTPVLLRDVCSHHFFSSSWSTALQPPSDALHLVSDSFHTQISVSRVNFTPMTS